MNMPDLKPCPFCGGEALLDHDYEGMGASYVRCKKCGLESIRFIKSFECASDDRAVKFWNMRADADCIRYMDAADVAPVRHGRWLPQVVLGQKAWDCSECKTLGSPQWKWCPVCGCKMDGGAD